MYTPLNGSVLNGSGFGVWAEHAVMAPVVEASAYIQRIVPFTGSASAASESGSSCVRERLVFSSVVGEATETMVATRIAGFDSSDVAEAIGTASAPIIRWRTAVAEVSAALPPPIPWRHAYTDASDASHAEFTIDDADIVVYAVVSVKRSPARAQIFVHESAVRELRTTIIPNSGFTLSTASTYAIANSPLGFGEITLAAESTGSGLFITHDFKGVSEATADGYLDPSRVRAYETTGPANAASNSEPNVTRGGVTYAYQAGRAVGESDDTVHALRVRIHQVEPGAARSELLLTPYFVRGCEAQGDVVAEALGELGPTYKALWYRKGQGPIQATAQGVAESIRYTWEYIEGDSLSNATSTADAIHYKWVGADGVCVATADQSSAKPFAHLLMTGATTAEAFSDSSWVKHTYLNGSVNGQADFAASVIVYGWTYFTSRITTEAITNSAFIRTMTLQPVTTFIDSQASGTYYLNIGQHAPLSRTYPITFENRLYTVESSTREYTV